MPAEVFIQNILTQIDGVFSFAGGLPDSSPSCHAAFIPVRGPGKLPAEKNDQKSCCSDV